MARLAVLFGTVPAFTHNFTPTAWFGDDVLGSLLMRTRCFGL
jgi:hypothetical protein